MSADDSSLEGLLRDALDRLSADLFVSMPGTVKKYNAADGEADVEPGFLRRYAGKPSPTRLPLLQKVPVLMPRTSAGRVHLPLSSGDPVLLVFADRSMENWLSGKGEAREPQRVRSHDIMDAIAIPGFSLRGAGEAPTYPDAISVEADSSTPIYVGNGQVIPTYGDLDVVNLMYQIIKLLSETKGNLGGPISSASEFQIIRLFIEQQNFVAGGTG